MAKMARSSSAALMRREDPSNDGTESKPLGSDSIDFIEIQTVDT
jgi:hypothetical protein